MKESLANTTQYANASQATVALAFDVSQVRLAAQDDGTGFDPEISATQG